MVQWIYVCFCILCGLKMAGVQNTKFDDFNDANEFITNYLMKNNHPCKHGSRNTIDQFNRKIRAADQRITDLPGDSVYSLRWICKHFGSFKSRAKENDNGKSRGRSH